MNIEEFENSVTDTESYPKKPRRVKDSSRLNALLIRGLPEWVNQDGVLETYRLAEYLNMSPQALYKQFRRERIAPRRIAALIKLSNDTDPKPEEFKPLTSEDFMEFLA